MAARQLKRLKEQLQAQGQTAEPESESTEEDPEEAPARVPFNPFDLLDEDEKPDTVDSEDDAEDEPEETEPAPKPAVQQPHKPSSSAKKKAKKKGKAKGPGATNAATTQQPTAAHEDEQDIDAILKELNVAPRGPQEGASTSSSSRRGAASASATPLLAVDVKKLRGDEELRRIFGAGVIEAVERQEAAESSSAGPHGQRGRRGVMPRNMPRRRALKKSMLVTAREDWPWMDTGLGMEVAGASPDGSPLFRYTWSSSYRGMQAVFEQAQASYDPNAIAAVLQQAPFHLDALLAMYDLYRSMGEAQYAEEVLNRALYALEMAWHPSFDPSRGRCRLDVEQQEDRALFIALFRHAQALSRRGCHSSALEVTKLLLACDPEDPMGALMQLDYLALRAGQYAFLQRVVAEYEGGQALPLLPNYAYAIAMARFKQEQQQQEGAGCSSGAPGSGSSSSGRQGASKAKAAPQVGDGEGEDGEERNSQELLVQALLLHPLVLPQLQGRLQGLGVGKDAAWQSLLQRKLFAKASDGGSSSLGHLVSIFVERSHTLWRTPDVQAWLKKAAEAAADLADQSGATLGGVSAADWATVARDAFPAAAANEYGHLRLSDFSDAVNMLPREEMQAAMAAGGMADVQDALDEQVMALLHQQQAARAAGRQEVSEEELRAANPLLMLLRSMLPWVDAGQVPDYEADDRQQDGNA